MLRKYTQDASAGFKQTTLSIHSKPLYPTLSGWEILSWHIRRIVVIRRTILSSTIRRRRGLKPFRTLIAALAIRIKVCCHTRG